MPFKEIKCKPDPFVRIYKNGRVVICASLVREYFQGKKVKVFIDEENKKVGLKPDSEGYKLTCFSGGFSIRCYPLAKVINGVFHPEWSEKYKMLIFSYLKPQPLNTSLFSHLLK